MLEKFGIKAPSPVAAVPDAPKDENEDEPEEKRPAGEGRQVAFSLREKVVRRTG